MATIKIFQADGTTPYAPAPAYAKTATGFTLNFGDVVPEAETKIIITYDTTFEMPAKTTTYENRGVLKATGIKDQGYSATYEQVVKKATLAKSGDYNLSVGGRLVWMLTVDQLEPTANSVVRKSPTCPRRLGESSAAAFRPNRTRKPLMRSLSAVPKRTGVRCNNGG